MTTGASVLLAVAVLAALSYLVRFLKAPVSTTRTLSKTLPVALLFAAAAYTSQPFLLLAGLGFSAIGDALLSRDGETCFLAGLAAFFLAHIAYALLFAGQMAGWDFSQPNTRMGGALMLGLVAVVLLRLWPHLGVGRTPVALYAFTLAAMSVSAIAADPGRPILLGVTLLIISDILLALHRFVPDFAASNRDKLPAAVWVLYFAGQALLIFGFLTHTSI